MRTAKQFLRRWKTEYEFKTFAAASGSLAVTAIFACYNGFLGLSHASLWYGSICSYYIILVLLRGTIIFAAKKIARSEAQEPARSKVYLAVSFLLLILNVSLVLPISMMVRQQKPVNMTLIPAIVMAAYTTYKVTMASINLKKRISSSDSLVRLLRTISFIDSLISILTLQNTLIMVHSAGGDLSMLPLTSVTSAIVWIAALLLSVHAIAEGLRRRKNM